MLVDAGNNDDGTAVVAYLKQQRVKKIDYLVGTHPHEDHLKIDSECLFL
jgi:competence protein ComEC